MIQLNILYPKTEGATFDWAYYLNIHMPLSLRLQGAAVRSVSYAKGVDGLEAAPVAFVAITTMVYDSVAVFMDAFRPHAETLQADVKNYTSIQPIIQFSEVVQAT